MIYVVDRGKIVDWGTHRDLLERGGLYSQLYAEQFDGGLVEARCEDGVVMSSGKVLTDDAVLSNV